MTKQTDKWGNEIEEQTSEHQAERKRIQESAERLEYSSAGATWRKRKAERP